MKMTLTVGKASVGQYKYSVIFSQYYDNTWTKDVIEVAIFEKEEDAIALLETLKTVIRLSKGKTLIDVNSK
jgi:hypothetical protein